MFFARCRKLSMFVDPFSLSEHFYSCKSISALLHTWQTQAKVFNPRLHGPPFLHKLKSFPVPEIEQALSDFRFKSFLEIISADDSIDSFLSVAYDLGLLHKKSGTKPENFIISKFDLLLTGFPQWTLELQCKAFAVLTLLHDPDTSTKELGTIMTESILKSLEKEIPTKVDLLRLMVPCRVLTVQNSKMFYVMEPFLLRDSEKMEPKELVQVFCTYAECRVGSKEFVQQIMMKILMKCNKMTALEVGLVLKQSCDAFAEKIFGFHESVLLLVQEVMKKLQSFTENELKEVLDALFYVREGNVHYYELLAIAFVRSGSNLTDQDLINTVYTMAQAGVRSEASSKVLFSTLRPVILSQASTIQGHLTIEKVSPVGLLSNSDIQDFRLQQAKHILFPDLQKQAKKAKPLGIQEIFQTTSHPFYNFPDLLKLTWSALILAENSNIETVDGTCLNLLIKLLNRHLSEMNKGFNQISCTQHDMLVQIKQIVSKYFPSLKTVQIPKALADYTLHLEHKNENFLDEEEKEIDKDFVEQLERFCEERFIKAYLPTGKKRKIEKEFYVGEFVVNIAGSVPGIIVRNCDMFRNGVVNEVVRQKVKMIGKVRVLNAAEWGRVKTDKYFEQILEV